MAPEVLSMRRRAFIVCIASCWTPLIAATYAWSLAAFDGEWQLTLMAPMKAACSQPLPKNPIYVTIANAVAAGALAGRYRFYAVSGIVDKNGGITVVVTLAANAGVAVTLSGRLSGSSGEGYWKSAKGCDGPFSARLVGTRSQIAASGNLSVVSRSLD
jgi:hypothetical protein